jgi:nuclear pore complex protein Nup107
MKRELREGLATIEAAVEPIFDPDFLADNPEQERILLKIRNHYLPEIVLAFNSALYFAGKAISRNNLVKCMDLANTVATTPNLTNAFVASGRMRELVNAIALDSQGLLMANEVGLGRKGGDKKVKGMDIWNVKWKEMRDGTLEALS